MTPLFWVMTSHFLRVMETPGEKRWCPFGVPLKQPHLIDANSTKTDTPHVLLLVWQARVWHLPQRRRLAPPVVVGIWGRGCSLPRLHGCCCETVCICAYCGLVVEIPTELLEFEFLLPFQR